MEKRYFNYETRKGNCAWFNARSWTALLVTCTAWASSNSDVRHATLFHPSILGHPPGSQHDVLKSLSFWFVTCTVFQCVLVASSLILILILCIRYYQLAHSCSCLIQSFHRVWVSDMSHTGCHPFADNISVISNVDCYFLKFWQVTEMTEDNNCRLLTPYFTLMGDHLLSNL